MPPRVLFVCTGNATRSVIAAHLVMRERPEWTVASAGTLAIEGLPSSPRTRAALDSLGLDHVRHRSVALTPAHLDESDVVIGFERHHVEFVRRRHPLAAPRTATIRRLARDLPSEPGDIATRIAALGLESCDLEPWEELDDPAGGDIPDFLRCARDVEGLVLGLLPALGDHA